MAPLRLADPAEYLEGFKALFEEAVRVRLRVPEPGMLGATLSAGLDSSSVVATAAPILRGEGRRLKAYTAVPRLPFPAPRPYHLGDEWDLAHEVAEAAGCVDHHRITSEDLSPIQGIRRLLGFQAEPVRGVCNADWITSLHEQARRDGCRALLGGTFGNGAFSFETMTFAPAAQLIRCFGTAFWAGLELDRMRERLYRKLPRALQLGYRTRQLASAGWLENTPFRAEFIQRKEILPHLAADPMWAPAASIREGQLAILGPGATMAGAMHAQMGAAFGIELRDPTCDQRLVSFILSIPVEKRPGMMQGRWNRSRRSTQRPFRWG